MKRVLIALCALLTLAACTKEINPLEEVDKGALQTIQVSVASFVEQTKTAVSPGGSFTWSASDQIGIYPVNSTLGAGQTSQQIVFKINGTGDAKSATFTGTGWGLVLGGGYKYFSYYPYSADAKYNEANVVFQNNLSQATNDTTAATTTAHLGVNDYLVAPQIQPTDAASCNFTFGHLGSLIKFTITVPADAADATFTRVEVTTTDSIFTLSGNYDPSAATVVSDKVVVPAITGKTFTNKLSLSFNGSNGFKPDGNRKIFAYFLVAPAAVGGKTLNIELWDSNSISYTCSKDATKDWTAGRMQEYICDATKKPMDVAEDLSVGGKTANCYIVSAAGKYKFLANVKGNGWDPLDETNHNAAAGINLTGCKATVLWETVNTNVAPDPGTIVNNSTIAIQGNYVVFDATGSQGNALISVKNAKDSIVWSWHIWSTSASLVDSAQTYPNSAVMMDRNLGALSATPGNGLTLGFLYQWGRPFPITGGSSNNGAFSSTRMATTNSSVWVEEATSADKGTLAYSAANPTHFIYASASNYYKGQSSGNVSGNWLWTADATTGYEEDKMPAFWRDTVKTMYDPCPIGWKVPKGGSTGVWATAGFNTGTFIWNATNKGCTFTSPAAYYPAAGYRGATLTAQGGELYNVGIYGFCWASSIDGPNVFHLYFNASNVKHSNSHQRAFGCPVRPVKE